jgi:hypothetical protein
MNTFCRWAAWLGVLAVVAAGCGGGENETSPSQPGAALRAKLRSCEKVGKEPSALIVLCRENGPDEHGVFLVDDGAHTTELAIGPPGPTPSASAAGRVGHWDWAALSPDGTTLLAQWSAECEVPVAFFIPASGGEPRVVSGEKDWALSPNSIALGWTTDGRAIVLFPDSAPCGSARDPGLYLVSSDGTHTRIRGVDRFAKNLERSVEPRTVASLKEG